jgi:hypothetical protein
VNHPFKQPRHRYWLHFEQKCRFNFSNSRTVIASGAKQSIKRQRKYGLLRRFAPRNDGALIQTYVRDLAAPSARGVD